MDINEFRKTYPQYNDMSDADVVDKFHAKYYSDMPKEQFIQKFIGAAYPEPERAAPAPSRWKTLASNLGDRVSNLAHIGVDPTINNFEKIGQGAGQIAGGINDALGAGVSAAYDAVMPEKGKQAVKAVQQASYQAGENAPQWLADLLTSPERAYKKLPENIQKDISAGVNVASLLPIGKAAGAAAPVGKEALNIGKDVAAIVKNATPEALDAELNAAVSNGIRKAIRPQVEGQRTAGQIKQYMDNATTAVKKIIENKDNLALTAADGEKAAGLPKSLMQLSEAIDQTKGSIFQQYDALATQAGQQGVRIDLAPIAQRLQAIAGDNALSLTRPDTVKYAKDTAKRLANSGTLTPSETQKVISQLNNDLKSFYRNPSYDSASRAYIDSEMARGLRDSLDSAIENSVGDGYQELKRQYGSLKAIERDVNRRAVVDARKAPHGLIDYTDIYTSPEIIYGVLTGNPAAIGKGVTMKAIKEIFKRGNDPNRIVQGLFEDSEKLMGKIEQAKGRVTPQSKTGNIISDLLNRNRRDTTVRQIGLDNPGRFTASGDPLSGGARTPFPVRDASMIQGDSPAAQLGYEGPDFIMQGEPQTPPNFTMQGQPYYGQANVTRSIEGDMRPQIEYSPILGELTPKTPSNVRSSTTLEEIIRRNLLNSGDRNIMKMTNSQMDELIQELLRRNR